MGNKNSRHLTACFIFFGFAVWVFSFWGYLTSKFSLTSDALSYYDHTRFYVDNLGRGVYPLWDPYWCQGVSNDFFLRRIGALNPLYLLIVFLKFLGIPFSIAYLWSLGVYYWGGSIAFYLTAMRIYNDRFIAYAGYLMILFSSLGTRLFDSYMMLVTVPLIWFFYFLTAFSQTPRKHFFLGMILAFMILASTYIPLYFLIVLGLFLLLFGLIYPDRIPGIVDRYAGFFRTNKILVVCSLLAVVFTFLPVVLFFHDSARGQIVLPERHGDAGAGHTLTVPHQTLDWGAVEDLFYSSYFSNLKLFKFAVVYVPFFSVIVFLLGLVGRMTRRTVFIFLLGLILSCCIIPHGLPFYDFFYKHLFFLKFFRNLHFFIWFFLLPLFVFLVLEHWHLFQETIKEEGRYKRVLLAYVFCVHLAVFLFVYYRSDAVFSTYVMIFVSLVFWVLTLLRYLKDSIWALALLFLALIVQPLEAYHYFSLKADLHLTPYAYDIPLNSFKFDATDVSASINAPAKQPLYYASGGYNFVYSHISNRALSKYLQHKLILVDRVRSVDRSALNVPDMEQNFISDSNSAFVFKDEIPNEANTDADTGLSDPNPSTASLFITPDFKGFKLLSFDADHLKLSLDLPFKKFLVYNDTYDPYWKVSVGGRQVKLYEVNGGFKGLWVPAGKSVIEFTYGCWWQYAINIFLSICAFIILAGVVYYAWFS